MIKQLKQWLSGNPGETAAELSEEAAVAALLVEVMLADGSASDAEQRRLQSLFRRLFRDEAQQLELWLEQGRARQQQAISLFEFTTHLRALPATRREAILQALWHMALADGELDQQEESIVRQVAELLYIPHSRFIQLKHRAQKGAD
ncbi:TerB family tellurite resistance protein [Oceanimonas sp. MB9]|uniref:tellurite resistance TerB family protein n=1 Tax=Oceanimonas sp. MB9 TaxID=2588453 RepID=UPI0013F5D81A|nr:TerB family tellurite resistance protein [Oceanimonas sp. MB9]NHI00865.1 hypothetical protein [Oceanimonas sp. MB9]